MDWVEKLLSRGLLVVLMLAGQACHFGELKGSLDSLERSVSEPCCSSSDDTGGLVLGEVVSLDDARFDAASVQQGSWAPAGFLQSRKKFGVFFVEAYSPDKPVVVLVHGINGSPRVMATLVNGVRAAGFQPWLFYYPSALGLGDLSAALSSAILALTDKLQANKLSVVAYSMGGLVARDALRRLLVAGKGDLISHFISVSSPFGGMPAAAAGVRYAPTVMPSWRDLSPGSPFLKGLAEPVPPASLKIGMIFSTPSNSSGYPRYSDGVVALDSQRSAALLGQADQTAQIEAGHEDILHNPVTLRTILRWLHPGAGAPVVQRTERTR